MQYIHLVGDASPPDIGASNRKAMVIAQEDVAPARRQEISEWLIAAGCLYIMNWGVGCSAWAEAQQAANLDAYGAADTATVPDDRLAIVTWHAKESLEDVFWFAKNTAMHPCADLHDILLVHIAPVQGEQELLQGFAAA